MFVGPRGFAGIYQALHFIGPAAVVGERGIGRGSARFIGVFYFIELPMKPEGKALAGPRLKKFHPTFLHVCRRQCNRARFRSEEHTSELQSLMRISYAVFCLKKKKHITAEL